MKANHPNYYEICNIRMKIAEQTAEPEDLKKLNEIWKEAKEWDNMIHSLPSNPLEIIDPLTTQSIPDYLIDKD